MAGVYKPGGAANTIRSISFSMKAGVAIYGGFVGSETSLNDEPLNQPRVGSCSTTLSGDIWHPRQQQPTTATTSFPTQRV